MLVQNQMLRSQLAAADCSLEISSSEHADSQEWSWTRRISSGVRTQGCLKDREGIRMRKGWVQLDTRPRQGLGTPSPLPHRALPLRTAPGSATGPAFLNRLCGIEKGPKGTVARGAEEGERKSRKASWKLQFLGRCHLCALPMGRGASGLPFPETLAHRARSFPLLSA